MPHFPVHLRGVRKWSTCLCVPLRYPSFNFYCATQGTPGMGQVFAVASAGFWNIVQVRMLHQKWDQRHLTLRYHTSHISTTYSSKTNRSGIVFQRMIVFCTLPSIYLPSPHSLLPLHLLLHV